MHPAFKRHAHGLDRRLRLCSGLCGRSGGLGGGPLRHLRRCQVPIDTGHIILRFLGQLGLVRPGCQPFVRVPRTPVVSNQRRIRIAKLLDQRLQVILTDTRNFLWAVILRRLDTKPRCALRLGHHLHLTLRTLGRSRQLTVRVPLTARFSLHHRIDQILHRFLGHGPRSFYHLRRLTNTARFYLSRGLCQ